MIKQFGRVVDGSNAGPGAQQFVVPAKTHPGAPKYSWVQQVALLGHALCPFEILDVGQSCKPGAAPPHVDSMRRGANNIS